MASDTRYRLLNRDGTFNSGRHGLPRLHSVPIYESLATIGWGKFYLVALAGYSALDLFFALVYLALGPEVLHGATATSPIGRFAESFFFSVHTSTTLGYGSLAPATTAANLVVAVESFSRSQPRRRSTPRSYAYGAPTWLRKSCSTRGS